MNIFLQQGKQYFLGRDYQNANRLLKENHSEIQKLQKDKLALAQDIAACSSFMLKDYQAANTYISQAILNNPDVVDFFITKGAILRCQGYQKEAIEVLTKVQEKVKNPAIYYNLRFLAKESIQKEKNTENISKYEDINRNYRRWDGIVPSFLKNETTRSDYIYAGQKQMIKELLTPISDQENISQLFKKYQEKIHFRYLQKQNYGLEQTDRGKILLPLFKQLIEIYDGITKLKIQLEKEKFIHKLIQLLVLVKQDADQQKIMKIKKGPLLNLAFQVKMKSQKQVTVFKNYDRFQEAKKQVLSERVFKSKKSEKSDMCIAITEQHFLIYINNDFIRFFTPKKSKQQILKYPKQVQRFLFNFYWFICLRIIFCSEDGMSVDEYLLFRQAISFIYAQIDIDDSLKFENNQQLIDKTIHIFQKYNQLFTAKFIIGQKKSEIFQNCQQYIGYLSETDYIYLSFLKNQKYVQNIYSNVSLDVLEQQKTFRQNYNLNTSQQDKIAENLVILFFYFVNAQKKHQLLLKSFAFMLTDTNKTLNGKESFYRNYYQQAQPKQFLLKKLWKKFCD